MKIRNLFLLLFSIICLTSVSRVSSSTLMHVKQDSLFKNGVELYFDSKDENAYSILDHADVKQVEKLKKQILSKKPRDLVKLRNGNEITSKLFFKQSMFGPEPESLTPEKFKELCIHNPIWLSRECNDGSCELDRGAFPKRRFFAESKTVQDVTEKLPNKDALITIAFFGSGGLLHELIVMTKLIAEGYKNFRIILIDTGYMSEYVQELKQLKTVQIDHKLVNPAEEEKDNNKKLEWQRIYNYKFAQFIQWLNHDDSCNISTVIYADSDDYIKDCRENELLKADAIVAMDYYTGPDIVMSWGSFLDFYKLVLVALKVGGRFYESAPYNLLAESDRGFPGALFRIAEKRSQLEQKELLENYNQISQTPGDFWKRIEKGLEVIPQLYGKSFKTCLIGFPKPFYVVWAVKVSDFVKDSFLKIKQILRSKSCGTKKENSSTN